MGGTLPSVAARGGIQTPLVQGETSAREVFAEFLANGYSVAQAARAVGASRAYGNAMLQRIRQRLGAQAV